MSPTNNLPVPSETADRFPEQRDLANNLPTSLDGSKGTNRHKDGNCLFEGNTDLEAIEAWLEAKEQSSPNTLRSYRREAYRLLAWSIYFKNKPLSSLKLKEVKEYHHWLAAPETHPEWAKAGWELFRGPLSDSSQRQALVILSSLFGWLREAGYLAGNPFKLYSAKKIAKVKAEEKKAKPTRLIPLETWGLVQAHIDDLYPKNNRGGAVLAYERQRFILTFLYWTGLRRSELATATMGGFSRSGKAWSLSVMGKGRTLPEDVTVLDEAMDALRRYRTAMGMPPNPNKSEIDIPVVTAFDRKTGVSDHYINSLLKSFLRRIADRLEETDIDAAATLRKATAHWMRHTLTTHNAHAGVPINVTAKQLRHKSIDTTRNIYEHATAEIQSAQLNRLSEFLKEKGLSGEDNSNNDLGNKRN